MSFRKSMKKRYAARIFSSRKGSEQLRVIFNNIFYVLMIIIGIVIVANSISAMKTAYSFRLENVKFNNYVARIMYSSDCFAYEDTYDSELGTRHRVYPGTIDVAKLDSARLASCLKGLAEKGNYDVAIAELSDVSVAESISSAPASTTGSATMLSGFAAGDGAATTCESEGFTCIEDSEVCSGNLIREHDDSCGSGFICCNGTAKETFGDLAIGKVYYSSMKKGGAYDYSSACKDREVKEHWWSTTKQIEWDRVATFFVEVHNGTTVNRGILKFCYAE